MTSKSSFLVLALIASGCLTKACGQPNVDEPAPDQSDVNEPMSGVKGAPYVHVTPADIGTTVGPGVIGPYPTITYTGSCNITTPGTTIEDRIVNCTGEQLKIDADNVTIRNSVVTISGTGEGSSGIRMGSADGTVLNFLMEYSHLDVPNGEAKIMNVWGPGLSNDFRNFTIRNSHVEGGFDMFDMAGNLDGMLIENNVLGPLACEVNSDKHSDAFQIGGKSGANESSGNITLRGNYIFPGPNCGRTAIWYGEYGDMNTVIESNHLTTWGASTLWASDKDTMQVRYNIYDSVFESQVGGRCAGDPGCATSNAPLCCGYPAAAANWDPIGAPLGSAVCNRYEDGSFVEQEYITGVTHVTTGCPDYP